MDVAHQPGFLFHILAGFNIKTAAARKCSHKEVSLVFLAGDRVKVGDCAACPVNLHCLSRLVSDTHSRFRYTSPSTILVPELSAHIRLLTIGIRLFAILLPQKSERYALFGKFGVDVLVVDRCIQRRLLFILFREHLIQHGIGDVLIKRPLNVHFFCTIQHFLDLLMRTSDTRLDTSPAVAECIEP